MHHNLKRPVALLLATISAVAAFSGPGPLRLHAGTLWHSTADTWVLSRQCGQVPGCREVGWGGDEGMRARRGVCLWMQTTTTTGPARTKPLFNLDKLKVERYQLFPAENASESLDFAETEHEGGQALRKLYHNSDKLVIVKYYKTKCSMCRVLQPLMDKVISEYAGQVHFVQLEVVNNKDVITQAGLQGVPTCHIFYRGMLVEHFSGLIAKRAMRTVIESTLETYAHLDEDAMENIWQAKRREFEEEEERKMVEDMWEGIVYPIKGIFAPGRVLAPVHWNHLFDRGGHSVGIADRLGPRDPLAPGRLIEQFLDNENCKFDATHGTAFMRALQKSDVVSTKGRLTKSRTNIYKPRDLVGRISDGESNLHFLENDPPSPTTATTATTITSSSSPASALSSGAGGGDGDGQVLEVCDQTGCAKIYE